MVLEFDKLKAQRSKYSTVTDQQLEQVLQQISVSAPDLNSDQLILYLWTIQVRNINQPDLVPPLIPHLSHTNSMVQYQTIRTLGGMGPTSAPAIPDLERLLENEMLRTRLAAKEALEKIRTEELPARATGQ